jgi:hypothetical protein
MKTVLIKTGIADKEAESNEQTGASHQSKGLQTELASNG